MTPALPTAEDLECLGDTDCCRAAFLCSGTDTTEPAGGDSTQSTTTAGRNNRMNRQDGNLISCVGQQHSRSLLALFELSLYLFLPGVKVKMAALRNCRHTIKNIFNLGTLHHTEVYQEEHYSTARPRCVKGTD